MVADYFAHAVMASPGETDGIEPTVRVRAGLTLPPGVYDLRLLARESTLGRATTRSHRLEVAGGD